MPYGRWFIGISCIVIHVVDVSGVEVEHVVYIVDSGYQVGGGWALNFLIIRIPPSLTVVRPGLS